MGLMDIFIQREPPKEAAGLPPKPSPRGPPTPPPVPPQHAQAPLAPAQFQELVDEEFDAAAAPHLSVYLKIEASFRSKVADPATRAQMVLLALSAQGHAPADILTDVQEAQTALMGVTTKMQSAREAALASAVTLREEQATANRARAVELRKEADQLEREAITHDSAAREQRSAIDSNFAGVTAYINQRGQELTVAAQHIKEAH